MIRRRPLAWIVFLFLSLSAHPLSAHGILQRSSPRANAVLPAAPAEILLEFNEAVDPRFSQAQVLGPQGSTLVRGGEVSGEGRRLRLPLTGGGSGVYTVRWRVLSAVDGHTAAGSFVFAVGEGASLPASPLPTPPAFPPLMLIVARWLTYLGALLLAGTVLFDAAVLRQALGQMDPVLSVMTNAGISVSLSRLRKASGVILLGALVFEFAAQGMEVLGGGIAAILRRDVASSLLVQTKLGWSLLVRLYATVLLLLPDGPSGRILRGAGLIWLVVFTAVIIFLGGPSALGSSHVALIVLVGAVYGLASILAARIIPSIPDVHVAPWRGASVIAAGVLLAGFTLASHAGGSGGVLAVLDWLHLMGAAVWVGGLPALAVVLRAIPADVRVGVGRQIVPRVSALAGLALLVMILTGTAASWTFVASLRGLIDTAYGRSLLVKVSLVAVVATLGAVNHFIFRPRIAARDGAALNRFRRSVAIEIALGAVILLTVAALGIMPPAAVTPARPPNEGLLYAGYLEGTRVLVRVTPAAVGLNEIIVEGVRASVRLRHLETLREAAVHPDGSVELTDGWWELILAAGQGQATFPVIIGGQSPPTENDPQAVRVLAHAEGVMRRVRTWRETEEITDGKGHVVETRFEAVRPNRLRYRTTSGSEAVIIGAVRFSREQGGAWTRDSLPQPIALEGPYVPYLEGASGVRFGGADRCGREVCRVVLWALPSGQAQFAARIGRDSGRIYRMAMVAPAHYMTSRADGFNAPLAITPP